MQGIKTEAGVLFQVWLFPECALGFLFPKAAVVLEAQYPCLQLVLASLKR